MTGDTWKSHTLQASYGFKCIPSEALGGDSGGDSDPSDSEWESASMVSETSTISGQQRGEGTYDPKMDRKIFLPKLTNDSTEEACWMWRADTLALIGKGCSKKAIEVKMRKSLASYSRGLWFCEKRLLGYSLLRILNKMKQSLPGEVGIQCDALLRAFYELSQWKGEPVRKYSMTQQPTRSAYDFLDDWEIVMWPLRN